uniref:ARAD1D00242p n=1 Tax=Blastobotrys adeninivorans TaxID=409370 RepID=A0A060TCK4_BLAAD
MAPSSSISKMVPQLRATLALLVLTVVMMSVARVSGNKNKILVQVLHYCDPSHSWHREQSQPLIFVSISIIYNTLLNKRNPLDLPYLRLLWQYT